MLKHTPLGRLGDPEDIANAVLFLVSPMSSWVSGQVHHRERRRHPGTRLG